MKILLVQPSIEIGHPDKNLQTCARLVQEQLREQETDLIVLPEMFSTGFSFDPSLAAQEYSKSVDFMNGLAKKYNCAVCGSVAVKEDGKFFNRHLFIYPPRDASMVSSVCYDKRHLFSFSKEDESFTAGRERVIAEWRGWKFLLQTCYDLRFPVFSRNRIVRKSEKEGDQYEYDAIIYVASWPYSRIEAWGILLKARAIENCCFVIGANASESTAGGHSSVINCKGKIVNSCSLEVNCAARIAEIDKQELLDFRKKFPVLPDADTFFLVNS